MARIISAFLLAGLVFAGTGATAASSGDALRHLDPPLVVDADGKVVGRYSYAAGRLRYTVAVFEVDGTLTAAGLAPQGLDSPLYVFGVRTGGPLHVTTDCTGASYIDSPPKLGVRAGAMYGTQDGKLLFYLADTDQDLGIIRALSYGIPGNCTALDDVIGDTFISTSPPVDLTGRFTPPFHLQ